MKLPDLPQNYTLIVLRALIGIIFITHGAARIIYWTVPGFGEYLNSQGFPLGLPPMLKQLQSFILPVTAIVIVPWLIETNFFVSLSLLSAAGMFLITAGFVFLVLTISMFIRIGRGTLAPWSPTQKLVTTGVYAHVRNPMIAGVFMILLGESMLFGSLNILTWASAFFVINTIYFIISEEPGLEKRFGGEYRQYRQNVPMWIPRFKPWIPPGENHAEF